jgi:biopolymer transport protein ExbD
MTVQFERGTALGTLSLTPLIDVVFLLLVFFLVATRFAEEDRETDLPLPFASEAKPLTLAPKEVFVNILNDGRYLLGGEEVDLDELEHLLAQAAVNNPVHQSVIIRADKRVAFDFVVQAINICKRAGIRKYMVNTAGSRSTAE